MTAIITGGTTGIGLAIARELSRLGYDIVLNYFDVFDEDILSGFNTEVLPVQGDVSIPEQAEKVIESTKEKFGSVDVLVNNAGITRDGLIVRMKDHDFDAVINTNLKGTFNMCRGAAKYMIKQKSGKIINISSVVGISGNAGQVNYSASKAGIIGLTKSLAKELGSKGVCVNAIAPGFIMTHMTSKLSEKTVQAMLDRIPLNRLGKPEEVAELAGFLAKSSYITGQVISIDGGMYG